MCSEPFYVEVPAELALGAKPGAKMRVTFRGGVVSAMVAAQPELVGGSSVRIYLRAEAEAASS